MDRVASDHQAILTALLIGGAKEIPSLDERLADFDEALAAEPKRLDPEDLELRIALGVKSR